MSMTPCDNSTLCMDILIFSTTAWDHPPTNWQSTELMDRDRTFAVTFRPVRPLIFSQPEDQVAASGAGSQFSVQADGHDPLAYQWRKNGVNIAGATNATLTLNSVGAGNSGGYSVVLSNPYGSVTSASASLAVLTDGADGNKPVQLFCPVPPSPQPAQDSLVVVTHGFIPITDAPVLPAWVSTLANDIQVHAPNWSVVALDWATNAQDLFASEVTLNRGTTVGNLYGKQLSQKNWKHIHLISHSAGAAVIQAIADNLKTMTNPPEIQMTFLDPFFGLFTHGRQGVYGQNAKWADCYSVQDWSGGWTSGNLNHAFNVDVSWVDPAHTPAPYLGPGGGEVALSTHEYPTDFYIQSVVNTDPNWGGIGYGFALSMEKEGSDWGNNVLYNPVGYASLLPNSPPDAVHNPNPGIAGLEVIGTGAGVLIYNAAHAVSDYGASVVGEAGFLLQSAWSALPLVKSGGVHPLDQTSTNTPAWLAVGLTITNAVNFVQFDAAFTDTNAAQGLMTVYWNTNAIGMVDERVASPGLQTYRFLLPGTVTSGLYTLSFRLDSFNNSSSIAVTNVATGFVGVTQPITLGISLTNGAPMLQLTGPPGYNYLVQTSTNLVDWTLAALLANMNGTVLFVDPAVTNDSKRFYRAVLFSPIAAPPLLQAQISGNDFILSWPTSAADYVLETSTNLITANSWTTVTDTPAIVNLQCLVTNQISGAARFYRLRK
jgi:hypothetical protein